VRGCGGGDDDVPGQVQFGGCRADAVGGLLVPVEQFVESLAGACGRGLPQVPPGLVIGLGDRLGELVDHRQGVACSGHQHRELVRIPLGDDVRHVLPEQGACQPVDPQRRVEGESALGVVAPELGREGEVRTPCALAGDGPQRRAQAGARGLPERRAVEEPSFVRIRVLP
jgi:hypothetical protein